MFKDFKKIPAHQNFAAAQGQVENSGVGHLVEEVLDFRGVHFAVIVVIEIAMDAALVAAVGQVQLDTQGDIVFEGLGGHFEGKPAH
jgi:hypothetical protein